MQSQRSTQRLKGILFVILSAIGFGLLPILNASGKAAGLNTWDRLAIRYFGSAILLLPVLLIMRKNFALPKGLHLRVMFISVFAFGVTSALLFFGYQYAPTGMVTVLHFIYPMVVMLLCTITGREKASKTAVVAVLVSLAGLIIIIEPWKAGAAQPLGIVLAVASAVTFALYVMGLNQSAIKKLDNMVLVFWLAFYSGAVFLVISVCHMFIAGGHVPVDVPRAILPALGLTVVATIGSASLFSIGNRLIGGTTASILSMFEPVTAVLIGWLVLGEQLHPTFLVGAIMVLVSTVVISVSKFKCNDL